MAIKVTRIYTAPLNGKCYCVHDNDMAGVIASREHGGNENIDPGM